MRVRFVLLASATFFAVATPVLAQGIYQQRPDLVADFNGGYGGYNEGYQPPRVYREYDAPRYGDYREYRQPRYQAAPVYEPAPVYEQAPADERAEGYGDCRTITVERDDGSYRRFRRCD